MAGLRRSRKHIIRSQASVAELVEAAGGEFVGPPGVQTTAEEVLRAVPDVLVAAWCGAGDRMPLEAPVTGNWNVGDDSEISRREQPGD